MEEERMEQFSSDWVQRMEKIRDTLSANGHQKEVDEFGRLLQRFSALSSEQKNDIHEDSLFYEVLMTIASLWELAAYLVKGDSQALRRLPLLLDLDTDFFLRQPWIINLIVKWRKEGKQKEITQLFFGTGKRGRRSFKAIMQQEERDAKIFVVVENLLQEGCSYNEAMRRVSAGWKDLGLATKLSPRAVRRVYEKRKAGYTPLRALYE
jgi:hypothetical protein